MHSVLHQKQLNEALKDRDMKYLDSIVKHNYICLIKEQNNLNQLNGSDIIALGSFHKKTNGIHANHGLYLDNIFSR